MSWVKFYTKDDVLKRVRKRQGESKLGESLDVVTHWNSLEELDAKYILVGIPEDIGVRANYGNPGTAQAWEAALSSLCNIQKNEFTLIENLAVLGEVNCDTEMKTAIHLSSKEEHHYQKLGALVASIDEKVAMVIEKVLKAGKFPIIIGGGHNNSFGNLKGAFNAFGKAINCLNFDAHTDFRALEHRHSGNGFSYAFKEGYLDHYFIFGVHRNYTSQFVFDKLRFYKERIQFNLFEDIEVKKTIPFTEAIKTAENFVAKSPFGLELDLDAIIYMGSSAQSPSGFSIEQARYFVNYFAGHKNSTYVHFCEGAPVFEIYPNQVGKALAYLISDIISA